MTTRWLAAMALVAALTGCADGPDPEPAIVPVAPGVSSPAPAVSTGPAADAASPAAGTTSQAAGAASPAAGNASQAAGAAGDAAGDAADAVLESGEIEQAQTGGLNAFVSAVRREFPVLLLDHRDEEIGAIAERACGSLARGRAGADVVSQAGTDAAGADAATARRLVELAVKTVCPDMDRRLES